MKVFSMTIYMVIKCKNCDELTYIREKQKTHHCKRCGIKNNYAIQQANVTAREAKEFIISEKSKNFSGGFTWGSEFPLG